MNLKKAYFLGLSLNLLILFGCGQVGQKETTQVSISFKVPSNNQKVLQAAVPTGITSITLEVTATDMQGIIKEVGVTEGQTVTIDLEVPSGPLREFKARAFNNDNTVIYEGKTTVDLVAGVTTTVQIDMAATNPILGTWGMQSISLNSIFGWNAETNKVTFNSDGTGVLEYQQNDHGILSSGTENFTYTTQINPDGSTTIEFTSAGSTSPDPPARFVFSDNGNMWIVDGTSIINEQGMAMGIKLDTSKVYGNPDYSGDYYAMGYGYNSLSALPAGNIAISAIGTPNGSGATTSSGTQNLNGTLLATFSGSGTYTVNTDGLVTMGNGFKGYLTGDGVGMVGGHPSVTDMWTIGISLKKQDRTYSTADLAGTWAIAGFGDDSGTSFAAEFGTMTCDTLGNCALTMKVQTDGVVIYTTGTAAPTGSSLAVAPDGSFGSSASPGAPSYAGAIGNNGNTIIMNFSFETTTHREILIGVRCSTCIGLAGAA